LIYVDNLRRRNTERSEWGKPQGSEQETEGGRDARRGTMTGGAAHQLQLTLLIFVLSAFISGTFSSSSAVEPDASAVS